MEDLCQQLADNPQAAVTFATTEHFNLQTQRAATIVRPTAARASFWAACPPGLIALGFAAQGGDSVATMRALALVVPQC